MQTDHHVATPPRRGHAPAADQPRARRRPIRVLELRAADGAGGGPEKTILMGTARADPDRFAITVCYVRHLHDAAYNIDERARQFGVEYVEIPQRRTLDPGVWRAARRLVRERGFDIVHAHDYKTDLLALLLARRERVIPLATAHGWCGHTRRERFLYYPMDKRLLARFPMVVAVSSDIRRELIRHGAHPERVRIVLNGIDSQFFRRERGREAAVRARFGIAPGETVIGSLARLEPVKRYDVLLQAFAALLPRRPGLRLLIAGEGSARGPLEGLARRLGVDGACRFLGHCPDVVELHHAFDLFVQASEYEGTPNVVLEAMAMETPAVATDAGGTAEIMHDGVHGLIIPHGDPGAIVRAVERTLGDPEGTRRRAAAARGRVEGELAFATRMRVVEEIYEELITNWKSQIKNSKLEYRRAGPRQRPEDVERPVGTSPKYS